MDKIDPQYLARSSRIDLKETTRIKATSEEANKWVEEQRDSASENNYLVS
jgi:ubiquitin conjugation factor E4 B